MSRYDELTAQEHLWLYGALKNINRTTLAANIPSLLQHVKLERVKHKGAGTYSGGMKRRASTAHTVPSVPSVPSASSPPMPTLTARGTVCSTSGRLSVAVSFIGDPKVVMLDEPTTGMDPMNPHGTPPTPHGTPPSDVLWLTRGRYGPDEP